LFAQEGASVVAADRNLAAAARTVDAMLELNGQGIAVGGDVSVAGDVEAMVDKAERVLQAIKTSSVEILAFLAPKTN
jgi:NAD(P)-dependent dehydrogenase (short-subunit alcohol dehydrogenase family)